MATSLANASWVQTLNVSYVDSGTQNTATDNLASGGSSFAAISDTLANGTSSGQANKVWHAQRSILTTANDDIDLRGGVNDRFGNAITFNLIKWFFLRLTVPATGKKLVIGNYGANGFTGWLGGNTQTHDVHNKVSLVNAIDGWTVDATHRYLRINNPGGTTLTYDIVLVGTG